MKAIIIDDSKAMRMIISRIVKSLGFEVEQAENGRVAFDKFTNGLEVHLALIDWNMPEMNGLEFVKAMRADEKYANLKLVMITTESEIEQMTKALEAGADEYIMKPFTAEIIQEKLIQIGLTEPA